MPVVTNFGDSTTVGNTTLQQNLTVQGAFSTFSGNIYASSSSVGIGNVATPVGNVYAISANVTTMNTSTLISTSAQIQGNVVVSNALTTQNVFVSAANVSGVVNTFSLAVASNVGIGTTPVIGGPALYVQGNVFVSNSV